MGTENPTDLLADPSGAAGHESDVAIQEVGGEPIAYVSDGRIPHDLPRLQ